MWSSDSGNGCPNYDDAFTNSDFPTSPVVCELGSDCSSVKNGHCRYWHPCCRYGLHCISMANRSCGFYHPKWHFTQFNPQIQTNPSHQPLESPEAISVLMSAPNCSDDKDDDAYETYNEESKEQDMNATVDIEQQLIECEATNKRLQNELDNAKKQMDHMHGCHLNGMQLNELSDLEQMLFDSLKRVRNKMNEKQKNYQLCISFVWSTIKMYCCVHVIIWRCVNHVHNA
eukprot:346916_1